METKSPLKKASARAGFKKLLLMAGIAMCHTVAFAQNNGVGAISQAQQTFTQYLAPVQKLLYAIAAIIALIGGFTIFFKMQNGDQDVKKSILMVVGGCVAFVALATALPAFFK